MTLHRARFIVRDAGFEHGAAGLVLSATTEPPPARPAKNIYMLVSHQKPDNGLDATVYYRKFTICTYNVDKTLSTGGKKGKNLWATKLDCIVPFVPLREKSHNISGMFRISLHET